ncbi:hypothetical protein GGF43_003886, partial [Coemansia sp. RSA 2618]
LLLVGNKLDLAPERRQVDNARARAYAKAITGDETALLEVSCREDYGVIDVFYELARRLARKRNDHEDAELSEQERLLGSGDQQDGSRCPIWIGGNSSRNGLGSVFSSCC